MPAWLRWPGYVAVIAGVCVMSIAAPSDRGATGGIKAVALVVTVVGAALLMATHAAHRASTGEESLT
jgi:hypothetical protein